MTLTNRRALDMRGPDTRLADLFESFRIARDARLSEHTMNGYFKVFRKIDSELGNPSLRDFTLLNVARVVSSTYRRSPSHARLIAATMKSFASWLAESRIWTDPTTGGSVLADLATPKFNGVRHAFSDEEFKAILRALDHLPTRSRLRDKAVVLTLMGCGLRLNELRQLRLADVHIERPLSDSWLLVRWNTTKSKGERKVRLDPKVAAALHAYIEDERPVSKHPELFLTEEGKPFAYNGMQGYSGRIGDRLESQGITGWMAHRGRHQWATDGARNGMTEWELAIEGGWRKGSKVPARYVDEALFRFEDLQRKPTALSGLARSA